jgi:hypothetical protein
MSTLTADIASLTALNAPLLCFDTCTVLDIMRDPTRESVRDHEQRAALDLLTAMETGTNLIGIAEWTRLRLFLAGAVRPIFGISTIT